jgi:recombination protein RecA
LELDPFIAHLQKAGLEVGPASEDAKEKGYLNTGNLALNWIISGKFQGGWPLGAVAEIFGDPSTGKSFIISRAIAQALQGGGVALLDDTEGAFNPIWSALALGVDTQKLAYVKSNTIEDHNKVVFAYLEAMRKAGVDKPSVLALDSLALLATEHELETRMEKESMKSAKVIKKHFRLTGIAVSETPAAYLIANHTIANIGDLFKDKTTPGGGGVKFQAHVRLELQQPTKLKDAEGKKFVGVKIRAYVEKNRLAPPWRKSEMIIPFYEPISPVSGLVNLLLDLGAIEKTSGHRIAYQEKDTGIYAYVTDLWKQDASALDLLSKFPDLITTLDTMDLGGKPGGPMVSDSKSESTSDE